jgi:uncharacterized protein YutE (UPF0331/DUF86 family)
VTVPEETEERILDKAIYVEEAVSVLIRKQTLSIEEYLAEREQRSIVEREFQTAIEACIDIASLLCKELDGVPEQNAEKFYRLPEHDVVSPATGERMKEAARFRTVLAHNYGEDIDDELVYRSLQVDLDWFPTFLRDVREYIGT